jgi:hypothetical protein
MDNCLISFAGFNIHVSRRLYQTQTKLTSKKISTASIAEKPSSTKIKINEERENSLSLKVSAKNLNDRLKRGDVVIYKAPPDSNKFFWWWHIAAFLQFIFW